MLTRVFLAAGVAALAIAAPASAERGGQGGGKDRQVTSVKQSGGGQRAQAVERRSAAKAQRVQRTERVAAPRAERTQRFAALQRREERAQATERRVERANRVERAQLRAAERQQVRGNRTERIQNQGAVGKELRGKRAERLENRIDRRDLRAQRIEDRIDRRGLRVADGQVVRLQDWDDHDRWERGVRAGWIAPCPPGLVSKGCVPPGHGVNAARIFNADAFRASRLAALTLGTRFVDPVQAVGFIGSPLSRVANIVPLMTLPPTISYLYPDTDDYYYRYGGGYMYRVDRDDNLIAALLPLLAGGFLPGQVLPTSYMNSFVPNYYGFNSFYPDSPYDCHRYVNGVIYEVDCVTGLIEDVVPLYAGGYGVGQLLPSTYGYYNVPSQYRSLYYNTPDYNYWYAPGAIYQVDPGTSLITSIASLLTPGFSLGQPLPMGYSAYNVPYAYRTTYYDTPNAWYRYNNGNIYQIDPTTLLVTAIVASILT